MDENRARLEDILITSLNLARNVVEHARSSSDGEIICESAMSKRASKQLTDLFDNYKQALKLSQDKATLPYQISNPEGIATLALNNETIYLMFQCPDMIGIISTYQEKIEFHAQDKKKRDYVVNKPDQNLYINLPTEK